MYICGWVIYFSYRYKSKPADDYEDPKDVQAIKEAQVFMGDFNLKTAPDYKIPEHMRINAAKKEEELGQLDSMVLRNTCVFQIKKNDLPASAPPAPGPS